ncbi:MAG: cofactor-independent phosphoglycerate mutase [Defluviitaleaceae bacterium]|nr:cofactor-independent phosphoglycerate mutase [Defluviitaleaceae bacterium]MCL2262181.1 cofactor-independent phosphoglycerate mutase [Defluviitaleaceae bacterium]
MKFFILVADGCGDWKIPSLGNKTPLEVAKIPHINALAKRSEVGLVKTVPDGMEPGSDVANLAVLGYDPAACLTGRAPLEAAAMGIEIGDDELAIRTNLVTLSEDGKVITDHSAGDIESEDAEVLMRFIQEKLGGDGLQFYAGVSYRCLLVAKNIDDGLKTTPPHDILEKEIAGFFPSDAKLSALMQKSFELLKNHPLNIERVKNGKPPANCIWFWGQGKKMSLGNHHEKYGVKGTMITAVNLLKGIGGCAGFNCPSVPGATGTLHTNYEGKAQYAIDAFESGKDFVFLHVEAPDECSHSGDLDGKLLSLEYIDRRVFKTVHEYLQNCGEPYRILILPDHLTPVETRTHAPEPVPFVLFDSTRQISDESHAFSEDSGSASGKYFDSGVALAEYFFAR